MFVDITERKVSIDKLDAAILAFEEDKESFDKTYLFMNEETASALTLHHDFKGTKNKSYPIFTYCGHEVYLDERLSYGEIDIR